MPQRTIDVRKASRQRPPEKRYISRSPALAENKLITGREATQFAVGIGLPLS